MKLKKETVTARITALVFLIALPATVAAQSRPNPPTRANPLGPSSAAVREMREREMNIRRMELEKERNQQPTFEVSKETTRLVNEDFARIQTINAEVMHDYTSGAAPDYKHISEAMAEINKRAVRLNANLLLPSTDEEKSDQRNQGVLARQKGRSPLLDLNELIGAFVSNPIFKTVDTIDAQLGKQAKRDLQDIITLSDTISKSAVKLSKTTATRN
ncbi:MAG TPA: hypothetical protein VN743_08405 [Blastocatellia bacterium]|nr:hypothetical protein [Blastocatellia bacterium]